METALVSIESLDEGEHFTYTNVAKIHNVDRSTLYRRHRKVQAPKAEQAIQSAITQPTSRGGACSIHYQTDREKSSTHKRDNLKIV
jgi:hypothetical protein